MRSVGRRHTREDQAVALCLARALRGRMKRIGPAGCVYDSYTKEFVRFPPTYFSFQVHDRLFYYHKIDQYIISTKRRSVFFRNLLEQHVLTETSFMLAIDDLVSLWEEIKDLAVN